MWLALRVLGFVVTVMVCSWVIDQTMGWKWSALVILGGPVVAMPIVGVGRLVLDLRPTVAYARRVTTVVHYGMIVLGVAVIEALKTGRSWPWRVIPLPPLLGLVLMWLTGFWTLLTVANLALRGLGAPFAIALSQRLAADWMYAWTRNPMVLGVVAFLASVGLWFQSPLFVLWAAAVFLPVMLAFLKIYEERELEIRFGKSYQEYKAKTPMLWPRKPAA